MADLPDFALRFSLKRPYNRYPREGTEPQFSLGACGIDRLEEQLESDRGRIINSAAVRRLQQKTQVFALERNAAVRSRLTHSLEVQQAGRYITRTIFRRLGERAADYGLAGLDRAVETLVEMSCLMHDVGNPPFGHFGEAAISRWFSDNLGQFGPFREDADSGALKVPLARELSCFEGNAQAIRLISHLQRLNLTYVQAASLFKYTRAATEPAPGKNDPLGYLQKKPGYYFSEAGFVADMQQALGMEPGHRHPLAYIMEAADDISYCLADLEDSVDKGILTYEAMAEALKSAFREERPLDHDDAHFAVSDQQRSFAELIDEALGRAHAEPINAEHEFFVWLRVRLIHPLVNHAAGTFIAHIDEVFRGDLNRALLEDDSPCHSVIATLKRVAVQKVFSVPEVETLELQGYRIIAGLLDHYRPLLALSRAEFDDLLAGGRKGFLLESRLFKRLPDKHVRAYLTLTRQTPPDASEELWERYCRCRLLQDMVSGMTDQFALDEFRTLSVMEPL